MGTTNTAVSNETTTTDAPAVITAPAVFNRQTGNLHLPDGTVAENIRAKRKLSPGVKSVIKPKKDETVEDYRVRVRQAMADLSKVLLSVSGDGSCEYGITLANCASTAKGTVDGNFEALGIFAQVNMI